MTDVLKQLAGVKQRALEKAKVEREAKVIQLPIWQEEVRGAPNELVRSALFNVRNRRISRQYCQEIEIIVVGNGSISYTGQELRQDDSDVWLAIMHLVRLQPLGEWVEFTAYSMLKELGWPIKGQSYQRLRDCLTRMSATNVTVYSERLSEGIGVSLIRKFQWKDKNDRSLAKWRVWIEPEMRELYGNTHYTRLEWEQRKSLGSLAKWLHGLYASHRKPYSMRVETLKLGSGSVASDKEFKRMLKSALKELVACGFLQDWEIEDNLVTVCRESSSD